MCGFCSNGHSFCSSFGQGPFWSHTIFNAHVHVVMTHLSIAAVARPALTAAQSLCATPGTEPVSLVAALPTVLSKVQVLICRYKRLQISKMAKEESTVCYATAPCGLSYKECYVVTCNVRFYYSRKLHCNARFYNRMLRCNVTFST